MTRARSEAAFPARTVRSGCAGAKQPSAGASGHQAGSRRGSGEIWADGSAQRDAPVPQRRAP